MVAQELFRHVLSERFNQLRSKNPRYSLRAFARDLDQNAAALSQILRGKRRVSQKFANSLADRLALDPVRLQRLAKAFAAEKRARGSAADPDNGSLSYGRRLIDEYDVIADPDYYAVLSLAETSDFSESPTWIGSRLGISVPKARQCLQTLEALALMKRNEHGSLVHAGITISSPDEIVRPAVHARHEANFEAARTALMSTPLPQRDFTCMTMAVDPELLPEAKRMVREFLNKLSTFLESGERREVFEVCIQLFPKTRNDEVVS